MRTSIPLYDRLAPDYEAHFAVPRRRAYDTLAWEQVVALLPDRPARVVDAGCGVGRWARRFAADGHSVVGIEQSPGMRAAAGPGLTILACDMAEATLPAGEADLVIAMGSLQYTADPAAVIARFAGWIRPGGHVAVLVDGCAALVLELLGTGRTAEALERLRTRRGVWTSAGEAADLHLLDRATLEAAFGAAGLVAVRSSGLLVSAASRGIAGIDAALTADWEGTLAIERALAADPLLADLGKQILVSGRRPAP